MIARTPRLSAAADTLVFAFPTLVLCVPRGAGIFMGAVILLALLGGRRMGATWKANGAILKPVAFAVLAFICIYIASKLYFHTHWDVIDNPSRTLLMVLACWVVLHYAPRAVCLWRGLTFGLFCALVIVVVQKFMGGEPRPSGFVQAIAFANMVAALGLTSFARPGDTLRDHAWAWFSVICAALILMLNGTRGAMLAMLLTVFPLLIVRYRRFSLRMFIASAAAIAVLAVGSYLLPGSPVTVRVDQVVSDIQQFSQGNVETSIGVRLKIWHIGLQYVAQHPLTGAGVGQFARILHESEFCQQTNSVACILEHAHNDMVEAVSTVGIPGLLALLGLFLVPAELFRRALVASRANGSEEGASLAGAGLGVVMASLICGLSQVTMAHQANIVFFAGVMGVLLGLAWANRSRA